MVPKEEVAKAMQAICDGLSVNKISKPVGFIAMAIMLKEAQDSGEITLQMVDLSNISDTDEVVN